MDFWIEEFTNIHEKITIHLNKCLKNGKTSEWMTKERTCSMLNGEKKGNETSNFTLITWLPIMWKIFTGMLAEQVYGHIERDKLLPDEEKGCRRQSRGIKHQLMIDKMLMENCNRRMTNLNGVWIGYKKPYDMVPHTWIP